MKVACAAGAALMAVALGGCGGNSGAAGSVLARGPRGTIHVVMKNIAYRPATLHARVGETVTWINDDYTVHNVTYVSGPRFISSPTFAKGGSFTIRLTRPGTIDYTCTIHPGMDGSITVTR